LSSPEPISTEATVVPINRAAGSVPSVWVVTGYRAGERVQVMALAEALGWPCQVKDLDYRRVASTLSLFRTRSRLGINRAGSAKLKPPWPDLVISAGMRNEPVCRWIRAQSGGRTRIVHIGRPWVSAEQLDLVITTPQYRLPERANILQNALTMHGVTPTRLQAEAARWAPRFADLPRPWTAVIVGGNSGPFTLGRKAARRLAAEASAFAEVRGGSLLVTTSARTAPAAMQELARRIQAPVHLYNWQQDDLDNPYYGYLALADEFIVTADSISMLSEACATGKPVHMFDLGTGAAAMRVQAEAGDNDLRLSALLYRALMRWGPQRLSRDIRLVHDRLLREGRARWLGETGAAGAAPGLQDIDRAVARVKSLFDDAG
jgi:mitochondrial fission protein ELM1